MPVNQPPMFEELESGPPRLVVAAVSLLALFFLSGAIYLLATQPFTGIQVIAPAVLGEMQTVLADYEGPIWGIEGFRKKIGLALSPLGLNTGDLVTVFPHSPLRQRPIRIRCQVGFALPLSRLPRDLPAGISAVTLQPGRRLVVRVRGQGNFTGNKAYRAAAQALAPQGLKPGEGERMEIKRRLDQHTVVEHWIPVQ